MQSRFIAFFKSIGAKNLTFFGLPVLYTLVD